MLVKKFDIESVYSIAQDATKHRITLHFVKNTTSYKWHVVVESDSTCDTEINPSSLVIALHNLANAVEDLENQGITPHKTKLIITHISD